MFTCVWFAGACECAVIQEKGVAFPVPRERPPAGKTHRADLQLLRPLPCCLLPFQISHLQIYIKKGKLLCGTVCPNTSNCGFCQSLHNITSMYYSGLDSMSEQSKIILPNHEKELNTILLIACMHWFCCLALCKYKLSPQCIFSNDSHCSHCSSSTCLHLFSFFPASLIIPPFSFSFILYYGLFFSSF